MSRSLQDQLVQAGLATKDQTHKGGGRGKKPRKPQRSSGRGKRKDGGADSAPQQATQPSDGRPPEAAKSKRQQKREHRERLARVVKEHEQPRQKGEVPYRFTRGRHIKETWVSAAEQRALARGEAALVAADRRYALVPAASIAAIRAVDPNAVLVFIEQGEGDRDIEYGPPVPDDMMW